jgi:hypothetical protein
MYKQHEETADNLTSGSPILAKSKYLTRHNKGVALLRYSICKALGIETTEKWSTNQYVNTKM